MAALTPQQKRVAVMTAALFYLVVMGSVAAWLFHNADETTQNRIAQTPNVTVSLNAAKPNVPASWTDKAATPAANVAPAPAEDPALAAMPAWKRYAQPFDKQEIRPRIALIVTDLGLAADLTDAAQDLPKATTLAFSSLAPDLDALIQKARGAGHEILLTIPMEPANYPKNDPGPGTLLTALSDAENVARLNTALSRAGSYLGVMPSMGQVFVAAENKLAPVLDAVHRHGLAVVDGTLNKNSQIAPLSRLGHIPFARADVIVDAAAGPGALDDQLATLEKTAQEQGQAVGLVMPSPVAFDKVKTWAATLDSKKLVLAPLSATLLADAPSAPPPATLPPPVQ